MNDATHLHPQDKCSITDTCCQESRLRHGGDVTIVQRHERPFRCEYCGHTTPDAFIVEHAGEFSAAPAAFLTRKEPL